ncbi:MAG: ArgE/DapE family deacylase [Acidobacteria bacterium]|nr:ArgE/DapE family deacylase [Acidobacteriota bacterium]
MSEGGLMISAAEKKVLKAIDDRRDDLTEFLRTLIRFRTVTPFEDTRAETDDFILHQKVVSGLLERLGFACEQFEADASALKPFPGAYINPDRDLSRMPILVGTRRGKGGGRSLLLNGHYDVVPTGEISKWTHDPFSGTVRGDVMYGRGTCDMKGGIAAMIKALEIIHESGIRLAGDVMVQVVPDEESTSMGTLACCQRGDRADAAIIPEPTGLDVLLAVSGNLSGTIRVFGRAGHADMMQPHWREGGAVNAIVKAAKVIGALEELRHEWRDDPRKRHKYVPPDRITPTIINGGHWGVAYPEEVRIQFSANFIPGTENLRGEIEEKLADLARTDSWMREHPPEVEADLMYAAEVDEKEPIAQLSLESARDAGSEAKFIGWGSLSDAIHLINYSKIPTISFGPSSSTIHETDERVDLGEIVATAKMLALSLMRWCGCA